MVGRTTFRGQRAITKKRSPAFTAPALLSAAYVAEEIQVGDVVDYVPGTVSNVLPLPTNTNTIQVAGVAKGSSYTAAAPDVGKSLQLVQGSLNALGPATQVSNATTVTDVQTPLSLALLGGNVGSPASYSNNVFLNNAAFGDSYVDYNGGYGSGYHGTRDANGYPAGPSRWFFSLPTSGVSGQDGALPHSYDSTTGAALLPGDGVSGPFDSYLVTYQSPTSRTSGTITISTSTAGGADIVVGGATYVPGSWQSLGGNNYSFRIKVPIATNIVVDFNFPLQFIDIPRDGITPSSVGGEFYPPNVANAAAFSSARLMDLCGGNTNHDTTWGGRGVDHGPGTPGGYPWERIFRYINAVATLPGSNCKKFWINIPLRVDDNYITQCALLANSMLVAGIELTVEYANEVWNNGTANYPKTNNYDRAFTRGWILNSFIDTTQSGGAQTIPITSITASGGVATVTLAKAINQYFKEDGVTPFITNGAVCYAVDDSSNAWSGTNTGTVGAKVQVAITTGGALAANQFTYPCATALSGTMANTVHFGCFFNVTGPLVAGAGVAGNDWNLYDWWAYSQTLRQYEISKLWKAVRPNDKIALGLQQYGNAQLGSNANYAPIHFGFGNWLGDGTYGTNGLKTWCDLACIAPYVFAGCSNVTYTAGSNVVHNVPFAAYAVPGDSVYIQGGNGTTVVSGSGTDLTVADAFTTTSSGPQFLTYGYLTQAKCYISGTTLTIPSGASPGNILTAGTYISRGAPVIGPGIAPGTVITGYGTGGPNAYGTFTVNNSQTVGSAGALVTVTIGQADSAAVLQAMLNGGVAEEAIFMRTHLYKCMQYGISAESYEGGPDTSFNVMKMVDLWTYGQNGVPANPAITMGTIMTALMDTWFATGLKRYHHFVNGPEQKANTPAAFGSTYAINQSFGDQSPAYLAMMAHRTRQIDYSRAINAAPGSIPFANNTYNTGNVQTTGVATGMAYFTSNASARQIDVVFSVKRKRRYKLLVYGTDNVAVNVDVYLDFSSTKLGTVTLAANGVGSSTSAVAVVQTSAALPMLGLASGGHVLSFRIAAGAGGQTGLMRFTVLPY